MTVTGASTREVSAVPTITASPGMATNVLGSRRRGREKRTGRKGRRSQHTHTQSRTSRGCEMPYIPPASRCWALWASLHLPIYQLHLPPPLELLGLPGSSHVFIRGPAACTTQEARARECNHMTTGLQEVSRGRLQQQHPAQGYCPAYRIQPAAGSSQGSLACLWRGLGYRSVGHRPRRSLDGSGP